MRSVSNLHNTCMVLGTCMHELSVPSTLHDSAPQLAGRTSNHAAQAQIHNESGRSSSQRLFLGCGSVTPRSEAPRSATPCLTITHPMRRTSAATPRSVSSMTWAKRMVIRSCEAGARGELRRLHFWGSHTHKRNTQHRNKRHPHTHTPSPAHTHIPTHPHAKRAASALRARKLVPVEFTKQSASHTSHSTNMTTGMHTQHEDCT